MRLRLQRHPKTHIKAYPRVNSGSRNFGGGLSKKHQIQEAAFGGHLYICNCNSNAPGVVAVNYR